MKTKNDPVLWLAILMFMFAICLGALAYVQDKQHDRIDALWSELESQQNYIHAVDAEVEAEGTRVDLLRSNDKKGVVR